jgi:hypothetical protein
MMNIYLAEIVAIASNKDSRTQVRVLPHMQGIIKEHLPIWPSFFANHIITGKVGDLVWVIANEDFSVGYVLGYASMSTETGLYEAISIPSKLFDTLSNIHLELKGTLLNYRDIIITHYSEFSIEFFQRKDGTHIIAFTNGTLHIVRPNEITMIVGSSSFSIKNGEISMDAVSLKLGGKSVQLGKMPTGQVLVTDGASSTSGRASTSVKA